MKVRLEKSRTTDALTQTLTALIEWLGNPAQSSLRRAFTVWINRVLLPAHWPGVTLPEKENLLENNTMLAETAMKWTEQWKQEGLQKGLQRGRQEGRQEGLQEGLLAGEATVLARQLTKRFGPLPDDVRIRICTATADQLELWTDAILDAPTLAVMFAGH